MMLRKSGLVVAGRAMSTCRCRSSSYQRHSFTLMYGETGDPVNVLTAKEVPIPELNDNQVLVKMVAAPIAPADINLMQGTYGSKADLPAVPGNEGVGRIEAVGSAVTDLQPGDHVVPFKMQLGTWRTHLVSQRADFLKVDKKIPLVSAATMVVNPCTALRMLSDFGARKGDTVIQNGANSAVGQALIQIARSMGIKTVNVVRDRENVAELKDYLTSLGADYVLTDAELRKPECKDLWKKIARPRLAADCVSGKSATELMRHLDSGGILVNYGGMSKQPLTVPVSALIFKEITVRGFWLSKWRETRSEEEGEEMIDIIGDMMISGDLKEPLHELVKVADFQTALVKSMQPLTGRKQILVMDNRLFDQN